MMDALQTIRINFNAHQRHKLDSLSLAQLQHLADQFDLGRIVQMDQPFNTQCNLTDPFKTGQGTFILRARHGEEYGERVEFLHKIMRFLREHNFPAPEAIPTHDGKAWTLWGDRLVEVQRFIVHDLGAHRSWARFNSAGSELGNFHGVLRKFPKTIPMVPPEMRNDLSPAECFDLVDRIVQQIQKSSASAEEIEDALGVMEGAKQLLPLLMEGYERRVGSMPWTIVHGDYHPWNVLYRGDNIVGVIDYDFLQERERLFDIAYAMRSLISSLEFPPTVHEEQAYDTLPWWKLKLWLDHYDATTYLQLTNEERGYLPKELMRLQLVEVIACGLAEDPVAPVLNAALGLPLYEWIYNQDALFL